MCIALSLTGWFIFLDAAFTPNSVVVCVIIFNAAFGASIACQPLADGQARPGVRFHGPSSSSRSSAHACRLYPPEILPLPVRVKGVSLSTATNWFGASPPAHCPLIPQPTSSSARVRLCCKTCVVRSSEPS